MLTQDRAREIFERIRKLSSAEEVELIVSGGRSALTRFANNAITQNVAEENYAASLRVVFDGCTARASTNRFDDESLRRVVEQAESLAKVQQRDPDLLPMPTPKEAGSGSGLNHHVARTAAVDPGQRAEAVAGMVGIAKRERLTAAGTFAVSEQMEALLNSRGVDVYDAQTLAETSVTMLAENSSGWQKGNSPDIDQIDALRLAEKAAEKAKRSANPKELAAGKYTVILEPAAVLDLVGFMFWDFGGMALLDQRSFLNNRIGQKIFGENITIADDVYHPLQSGAAFDGEGVRRTRVELVKNGVIKNLVYARGSARQLAASQFAAQLGTVRPTGHGFPLPNEMGEAPMNIVFEVPGTTQTLEQMVSQTERAVYITRLWYIREVDPYEKILTGMTRDGTFLVENGVIGSGIFNFRFNQSLLHMLSNVVAMSEPVRASGEESFDMVVPAMKVNDFNFTEVTKF
ncbi:MAG: TldD/PmbA family protein [Candidatus Korobacteraceae bacterium]|jgi:predicted Zn-dependent protease